MIDIKNNPAVVIDNGSATTKLGYAGKSRPEIVISTAIGHKRQIKVSSPLKEFQNGKASLLAGSPKHNDYSMFVGTQEMLSENTTSHEFSFVVRNGLIQDWDALELLWQSCIYDQLRCNPEDHVFVVSESPFNSPENREQMAEIMFETFNAPGLYIGIQPIMALIAASHSATQGSMHCRSYDFNQLSGTVVDSGDSATTVVPVSDGRILRSGVLQIPFGGRDITSYVQELMRQNKRNIPASKMNEVARQIKEQYGYVRTDCPQELQENSTFHHVQIGGEELGIKLPTSSKSYEIGEELSLAGELLFHPSLYRPSFTSPSKTSQWTPLPELVDQAIQNCPIDNRRALYGNVVLSGGSTMFPNFGRRLQLDLDRIVNSRLQENCLPPAGQHPMRGTMKGYSSAVDVHVATHPAQKTAVWLGGSIIASHPDFFDWCMTKSQYEEEGAMIARQSSAAIFDDDNDYY